jgi:hypothetical protein
MTSNKCQLNGEIAHFIECGNSIRAVINFCQENNIPFAPALMEGVGCYFDIRPIDQPSTLLFQEEYLVVFLESKVVTRVNKEDFITKYKIIP